jgi:hypothetical protein
MTANKENASFVEFTAERRNDAKRAFTTRRVPLVEMQTIISGDLTPEAGDLVLARVTKIGHQARLESPEGRRVHLFKDDEIVVCYGNRYAPDQFEALIGNDLSPCNLVAVGGVAAIELSPHGKMEQSTRIEPVGLIGDAKGNRLNLRDYAIRSPGNGACIPTILVAGTAMNAGKTLSAASIVHGLKSAGDRVAAIKATGTGAGGDMWIMHDVKADLAMDFTDAGFATTYKACTQEIETATLGLIRHAGAMGCDFAVIEIADGLQQAETSWLLNSDALRATALGVLFAAYDALGAKAGVDMLVDMGHRVIGLSGRLTQSPLAKREAEELTGLSVFTPRNLRERALNRKIESLRAKRGATQSDVIFLAPETVGQEPERVVTTMPADTPLPATATA